MKTTMKNRSVSTVFIALAFRIAALFFEILLFLVLLITFIPMLLFKGYRDQHVDSFMIELKDYTQRKSTTNEPKR